MRVLVTGNEGYIGVVLVPMLQARGHEVIGFDSGLYRGCTIGPASLAIAGSRKDIRDATEDDFAGVDAVCHLAAISNDPVGDLHPQTTHDINYRASVALARLSKRAGVRRFIFSSSCSLYGAAGDTPLDETAAFNPVTPYGESKILAEQEIGPMADSTFAPVFLRNATAYGFSSALRGDLVVNNLVGYALTTGEVFLKSDGTPWRPLVHIEDVSRAFVASLEAPAEVVSGQAFNVGLTSENYRIREVAEIVESVVPTSRVVLAESAGPDKRNYRVSCDRIARELPAFQPRFTVRKGVGELYDAYRAFGLTLDDLTGSRLQRIARVKELQESGSLSEDLRWQSVPAV